ncbi:uncharacterized protein [Littorina saxatilis]|uniref:G-protein coupled receptors family 1 profile domain-containing protein n=1 Tax=Littorina saxatilis TaxID=31220 RepID=A0AAN9FW56_9CAEN
MTNGTERYRNESTSPDFIGGDIHEGARAFFIIVGVTIILSGTVGNCLFLSLVFKQLKRKRSVHILFVANLSLADLLTLGYWFTFFVLDLILNRHPVVNFAHCVVNGVIVGTLSAASVCFLLSISLNRYLHVCHSHLYSRVFTLPRTVAWCLLTWLASLLVALAPLTDTTADSPYEYNRAARVCSYSRARAGTNYVEIVVIVFSVLPMPFIAYCNFAIFRHWRKVRLSSASCYPLVSKEKNRTVFSRLAALVARATKKDNGIAVGMTTLSSRSEAREVESIEMSDSWTETDTTGSTRRSGCRYVRDRESCVNQNRNRSKNEPAVTSVDADVHRHSVESDVRHVDDNLGKGASLASRVSFRVSVDANALIQCDENQENWTFEDTGVFTYREFEETTSGEHLTVSPGGSQKTTDKHAGSSSGDVKENRRTTQDPASPASLSLRLKVSESSREASTNNEEGRRTASKSTSPVSLSLRSETSESSRPVSCNAEKFGRNMTQAPSHVSLSKMSTTLESATPVSGAAKELGRKLSPPTSSVSLSRRSTAQESTSTVSGVSQLTFRGDHDNPSTPAQNLQKILKKKRGKEMAFVRSLFVVFLLTVFSFIPFGAVIVVSAEVFVPPEVIILGNFFLFFNNSVNWIVYGVMNTAFRQGYIEYGRRMLGLCYRFRTFCP